MGQLTSSISIFVIIFGNFPSSSDTPHPFPLPAGERGRVRGNIHYREVGELKD